MLCRKCKSPIEEESKFCNHCGAKQNYEKSPKKRTNGEGTVYKDGKGKWIAEYTAGWDVENGKLVRRKRRKKGCLTRADALAAIPALKQDLEKQDMSIKFKDLYKKWMDRHEEKVTQSTINCYKSAYKYFSVLYYVEFAKIRTDHLQKCIDECPHGKRTKENMKALGTSLWRYGMQHDLVDRNYAEYIYIKKEETEAKIAFSREQLNTMWSKVDEVPGIKYVLILCYTGMRLGEMLGAMSANYHEEESYFISGSKTDAGKDRVITISPKIRPFFSEFGTGKYLFTGEELSPKKFRNDIYYPALKALDMDPLKEDGSHIYTPHCCRHTFATLMKDINAPATDKQKLIGHAKFEMTAHYTHTDIDSLKRITDNL